MNFIYVIHLLRWNHLIDLITHTTETTESTASPWLTMAVTMDLAMATAMDIAMAMAMARRSLPMEHFPISACHEAAEDMQKAQRMIPEGKANVGLTQP